MTEVRTAAKYHSKFDEALAEFDPKHREAILAFARRDMWWRRLMTQLSPALALQLAIDPSLQSALAMLDEFDTDFTLDDVAKAAGLEVPRHTRPAQLSEVGRKVLFATTK